MAPKNATPHNNQKLSELKNLVINYSTQKHKTLLLPLDHDRHTWHKDFKYINPASWSNPQQIPYVAATALVDAYSQLPSRPDLAFNSLWSASNNSYNDLFLSNHSSPGSSISDSKSIEYSVQRISQQLHQHIPLNNGQLSLSIIDTIKEYIKQAPDKNLNFVASYILKGISVESHNADPNNSQNKVREILIPSSYKTLKKKFPTLHNKIATSTGKKYSAICAISETTCKTDIDFGIPKIKGPDARKLVHATGKIIRQEVLQFNSASASTGSVFDDEKHWLSFLILSFLYATRNTAAHGNAATRLNSIFSNGESVTSSSWTFLFGYCYLSLILLCQKKIFAPDLPPIYYNSQIVL